MASLPAAHVARCPWTGVYLPNRTQPQHQPATIAGDNKGRSWRGSQLGRLMKLYLAGSSFSAGFPLCDRLHLDENSKNGTRQAGR